MAKWMKYVSVLMVIVAVASLNLSSTCKPKVMNNNKLIELSLNHPAVPSVETVFIENEDAAAIFCYGKIVDIEQLEESKKYTLIFCRIRDDDREIVVRASLHLQSKQLLEKTKKKQEK